MNMAGGGGGAAAAKAAAVPLVTNLCVPPCPLPWPALLQRHPPLTSSLPPHALPRSSSDVQTKYREAGVIANAVLQEVLSKLAPGVAIAELCALGDRLIEEATSKVYKSKKTMEKGIAFPTCISVNETVAHYSPLVSESRVLAPKDAVKVDLGVHLDGYCAVVAHTVVLGSSASEPVQGPQADVIAAAHVAAEVALRLIKPGVKNSVVTEAIEGVAAQFGVRSMASVQCCEMQRFKLEGPKTIPLKKAATEGPYKVHTFEAHETYAIEIAFTTGEGKAKETETRTTVFKRQPEVSVGEGRQQAGLSPTHPHPPLHTPSPPLPPPGCAGQDAAEDGRLPQAAVRGELPLPHHALLPARPAPG